MSDSISRKDAINEIKNVFDDVLCCNISVRKGLPEAVRRIEMMPSADRPKGMIHIDEVYRLIAGHSDYHGDSILSAFTCLVEGKNVKPIAPLDESADRPTGKWNRLSHDTFHCNLCGRTFIVMQGEDAMNYCPNCGAKKGSEDSE